MVCKDLLFLHPESLPALHHPSLGHSLLPQIREAIFSGLSHDITSSQPYMQSFTEQEVKLKGILLCQRICSEYRPISSAGSRYFRVSIVFSPSSILSHQGACMACAQICFRGIGTQESRTCPFCAAEEELPRNPGHTEDLALLYLRPAQSLYTTIHSVVLRHILFSNKR